MTDTARAIGLAPGTPILTPAGPVAVEALVVDALVLAVSGVSAPFQPVVALERVRLDGPLIRIRADALADGAPQDDLLLPAAHALLVDGTLVAAGELVDGHGVVVEPDAPPREMLRITLAGHDAVLAAGAAVETAPPDPDAPPCAPRAAPDGTLRALLAWRAELMGWAAPITPTPPAPQVGSLRDRLVASALAPAVPAPLPVKPAD